MWMVRPPKPNRLGACFDIEAGLSEALQKATSKMVKLYRMAKAAVDAPKGIIEEVIFPAAPEEWLLTLITRVFRR